MRHIKEELIILRNSHLTNGARRGVGGAEKNNYST